MPTNLESSSKLSASKKRKDDGNRLFSNKRYSAALACYRDGLEELPPYDKAAAAGANNNADIRDEIIHLEISLRSNIALALQKSAEEKQLPPLPGGVATNNENEVLELYQEMEKECNIASQLDSMNPKLYHRRGLARGYIAEQSQLQCSDSSGTDVDETQHSRIEEKWKFCFEDFENAIKILNKQTETTATKKQLAEATKVLENLRLTKKKSQTMQKDASLEQQQQSVISRQIDSNGHMDYWSEDVPPSPQVQKEYILQLLSRSITNPPIINGEAYYLVNMQWWQSWCCYVGLFSTYTATLTGEGNDHSNNGNGKRSATEIKQHCRQIDTFNQQILQLLPPGATLPPYLEQNRNEALHPKKDEKKKNTDDDSSTSSEDSDDDDSAIVKNSHPRPDAIDNSSLILPHNNEGWCCTIESAQNDNNNKDCNEDAVLLRNHLVRGYHYELLPREAYGTLRRWYGESSPHIVRRVVEVVSADADTAGTNTTQCVELYSEHWDVFSRRSSSLSCSSSSSVGNSTPFKCSACGSPTGKKSCQKCGVARYCNRKCQVNHWTYHKKTCSKLNKQKAEGSLDVNQSSTNLVLDSAWGRVGLNNLGNTCFLNSAMQVSLLSVFFMCFVRSRYLTLTSCDFHSPE